MLTCNGMAVTVIARIGFITHQPKHSVYILHRFHDEIKFSCQYLNGTASYQLAPNACIIVDKDTYYSIYNILPHPISYDWIMIDTTPEEMAEFGIEFGRPYYPFQNERITRILSDLDRTYLYRFGSDQFRRDADRLLRQVLELVTVTTETPKLPGEHLESKFRALRDMMVENPADKWSVPIMAKAVNLSPSYFAALYRGIYGLAPIDDLISIRIENAKNRIMAGESLIDISDSLGYANYTHFSRQFKKLEGVPPMQWKKQHKGKRK